MRDDEKAIQMVADGFDLFIEAYTRDGLEYAYRNKLEYTLRKELEKNGVKAAYLFSSFLDEMWKRVEESKQKQKELDIENNMMYTKLADCRIENRLLEERLNDTDEA